jgi:hypothetical protein
MPITTAILLREATDQQVFGFLVFCGLCTLAFVAFLLLDSRDTK